MCRHQPADVGTTIVTTDTTPDTPDDVDHHYSRQAPPPQTGLWVINQLGVGSEIPDGDLAVFRRSRKTAEKWVFNV